MKVCFKCGLNKSAREFYKHPAMGDGRLGKCRSCAKEDVRNNRGENKEYYLAFDRKRNAEPRDVLLYNLMPGERDKMRAFQNNTDPISGQPLTQSANLDHCHKTGRLRGLLNPMTNRFLIDDLGKLEKIKQYLENPPAPLALGEEVYGLIGTAKRKKKMRYGPNGSPTPQPRRVAIS